MPVPYLFKLGRAGNIDICKKTLRKVLIFRTLFVYLVDI